MKGLRLLAVVLPALAGVAVGAVSMNLLEMRSRPEYRAIIRALVRRDQGQLAITAERDGAHLRAAAHRWAELDACAPDGTSVLSSGTHPTDSDSWLTFRLLLLRKRIQTKGFASLRRIEEGIVSGKVAAALDAAGEAPLAGETWEQARTILGLETVDEAKELVRKCMADELR